MKTVRAPVLAGSWYPADAGRLAAGVDRWLAAADPAQKPAGRPWLAVAPHAGHAYSGPVAGKLFGLLRAHRPDTIFLLAPNHRMPLREIALSGADAFGTPLGRVPVDRAAGDRLADHDGFLVCDEAHRAEHAVEILLPFIQRTWPEDTPPIVPMLVPGAEPAVLARNARALREVAGPRDLLLVSSDFTHYGDAFGYVPFHEDIPMALERLDAGAILKILAGDAPGLQEYGRETGITMCGLPACCVALGDGPPSGHEAALLDYARSGDRDGDYSLSVSYAAILMSRGQERP